MKNKILLIIKIVIPIIIVGVLVNRCFHYVNLKIDEKTTSINMNISTNNIYNDITDINNKIESNEYYYEDIICSIFSNISNIKEFNVTDDLKNKFEYQIFPSFSKYTEFSYRVNDENKTDSKKCVMTLIARQDKKVVDVKLSYSYNDKYELDNIEILEEKVVMDENGKAVKYDEVHSEDDHDTMLYLVNPQKKSEHDIINVTDNFLKKFPDYETMGIVPDKNYAIGESFIDEHNGKHYIYTMNYDKTKYYTYEMKFSDDGKIDDIIINFEYEKDTTEDIDIILLESNSLSFLDYQEMIK